MLINHQEKACFMTDTDIPRGENIKDKEMERIGKCKKQWIEQKGH